MKKETSWEKSADWYDDLLKQKDTYQAQVVLPNLKRLLDIKKGELVLDVACGPGFFARDFLAVGARVTGVDASRALIAKAKKELPKGKFYVGQAHELSFLNSGVFDKVTVILAIQNIEQVGKAITECARVLKPNGRLYIVMNHPTFRIPKESSWGWDETGEIQYRRIDAYLSESKVKIQMHPGDRPSEFTISFHRPLQFYFKALRSAGFTVRVIEEWESHRKSQSGPRAKAEDRARKEIPLFLFLEAVKL